MEIFFSLSKKPPNNEICSVIYVRWTHKQNLKSLLCVYFQWINKTVVDLTSCLATDLNLITVSEVPVKLPLLMLPGIGTFTAFPFWNDEGVLAGLLARKCSTNRDIETDFPFAILLKVLGDKILCLHTIIQINCRRGN